MHKWIKTDELAKAGGAGIAIAFSCALCGVEIETYSDAGYRSRYGEIAIAERHAYHLPECAGIASGRFGGLALARGQAQAG